MRNFWNEITDFFYFFLLFLTACIFFVKIWTPALHFIFGWLIFDENNRK